MNKKVLYPLAVLVLGFGLAALVALNEPQQETTSYERQPVSVRVSRVQSGAEHLTINSQGTVQPRSESALIPEVSGRAVWISPDLVDGGSFAYNDVLLRIDDADYRTALQRAAANLKRSQVEHEFASDELKRLKSLHKQQLASQQQLDNARRAAQVAEAHLSESRAAREQAERDLARTELGVVE